MNIIIFANKKNKSALRDLLNSNLKFVMFFVQDHNKIGAILKANKYDLIVSFNESANNYLKKNNIRFKKGL